MKAVILNGGVSSRLFPFEDKNLLTFLGKTLLEHHIEKLCKVGISEYIIIGSTQSLPTFQKIVEHYPIQAVFVEQPEPRGMADALLRAEKEIGGAPIMITASSDVVEVSAYEAMMKAYTQGDAKSYLLGYEVKEYFPGGYLVVDEAQYCKGIVEKPGAGNEPSTLVNIVVHVHTETKALLERIKNSTSTQDDVYEVAMGTLMKEVPYKVVPYEGFWQAVKYPWHVLSVMQHFLSTLETSFIAPSAVIAPTATIAGTVYIEEGVKIFDHSAIKGPVYLGKDVVVANNALVRDGAMIHEKSVVGFGTEVARSYWGSAVWTHTNYIGDSVVGNNVSFGSGTVTANLRLDEKEIHVPIKGVKTPTSRNKIGAFVGSDTRIGCNCTLMPGVKIGSGSFLGAGILLSEDCPKDTLITIEQTLRMRPNLHKIGGREELRKHLS